MEQKRVILFAGHYGSGKTNLAVGYALKLRADGKPTVLADLDIVNPYFRAKDSRKVLEDAGVRFISSIYANSNVDTPAIPAEAYSIIDDRTQYAVVDVGGDDRGALALGRYAAALRDENDYAMYLVINAYRPLTRTVNDALAVKDEIESAGGLKFTGIINNSNLGADTTAADIIKTDTFMREISRATQLLLIATTVRDDLAAEVAEQIDNVVPITLRFKENWIL